MFAALRPLQRAFQLWSAAGGLRMSAAMSFYGILSLAPLLMALVAILGWWVDREMLTNGLVTQIGAVVGQQVASLIQSALVSAREPSEGVAATVVGFVVILAGATGVFSELETAFERVWHAGRETEVKTPWWHGAALRLRGIGYIMVFGFLLLVSLAVSTLLSMASTWVDSRLALGTALHVVNEVVSLGVSAALFFGLMRLSGGAKPGPRYLLLGAFVGAILFTVGRQVLTIYLSKAAVVSAYGAAGSLIALLVWMYFSSAVLLFGAACARAAGDAAAAAAQASALRCAPQRASADTMAPANSTARPQA